jgi:exodeoxyribonuclease VII small subunit
MATKLTYESAYDELKQIVADIEDEEVTVDQLADQVKRASELIAFCQNKLRSTEDAVQQIIREMEDKGPENVDTSGDLPF